MSTDEKIKKKIIDSTTGDVLWEDGKYSPDYIHIIVAVSDLDMKSVPNFHHISTEGSLYLNSSNPDWMLNTRWAASKKTYWFSCMFEMTEQGYFPLKNAVEDALSFYGVEDKIIGVFRPNECDTLLFNTSLIPPEYMRNSFSPLDVNLSFEVHMLNMMLNEAPNPLPVTLNKLCRHLIK